MATKEEIEATLARSRKLVAESRALIEGVELRRQETDRLLASQGLTREKLASMKFTDEQLELVDRELKKRGFPPLPRPSADAAAALAEELETQRLPRLDDGAASADSDLENRTRKFGSMMQGVRL